MSSRRHDELVEALGDLGDYYSDITGRNISLGIGSDGDVWLDSGRTNGREYFENKQEAERRIKLLYQDLVPDDDDSDGLEGY